MAKKANNAAPKTAKINPEMEAANPELEAPIASETIASPTQSEPQPAEDFRAKLVAKAQAARNAARVGLIPQEQADALWQEAVEESAVYK